MTERLPVEEWVKKYSGVNASVNLFATEQEARSFIDSLKPTEPICIVCGAELVDGGYFINGQYYCTNHECAKKGLV